MKVWWQSLASWGVVWVVAGRRGGWGVGGESQDERQDVTEDTRPITSTSRPPGLTPLLNFQVSTHQHSYFNPSTFSSSNTSFHTLTRAAVPLHTCILTYIDGFMGIFNTHIRTSTHIHLNMHRRFYENIYHNVKGIWYRNNKSEDLT